MLALADDLPRLEDVDDPSDPQAGEVRLVAAGRLGRLPPGHRERAEAAGVPIIEASDDRLATVRALLGRLPGPRPRGPDDKVAGDYLALGRPTGGSAT